MNGHLTLESVVNAENFLISKLSRRRRAHSNFKRMLRINERLLLPRVNEWLNWTIKQIHPGLAKMRGRTPTDKVKSIADWNKIKAEGVVILKPAIHDILNAGGNSVIRQRLLRKQERFDPIGVEAVAWANQHSAELVTEITNNTMKGIRAYIAKGINAGKSVPAIARELRPLVGLTEKNIFAVANFHEKLILDRPELTAATQRSMAEVYARRLHRDRAILIARTETASSLNEGARQGYDQMGITHLERVEDQTDPADECTGTDGKIYTIEEAEGVLPAHPRCEGTFIAALGFEPKPYVIEATGPRAEKVKSVDDALKELPPRHVYRVEKFHIDTTSQINAQVPSFKGQDIAGYWDRVDRSVHLNSKWYDKGTIFHEVGHAVQETGGFIPLKQEAVWKAWFKKAEFGQIKYPSQYALTNEAEFFAECYSHYYAKNYHLIDDAIKKWFDKTGGF